MTESARSNGTRATRRSRWATRIRTLVKAIDSGDDASVERAILDFSRSRRIFAPLGLLVGALLMLFQAVKLLFSNWRLALIEVLPAMWIWLAMFDLKVHVIHGKSFRVVHGFVLIPLVAAVALLTALCFYLNAGFAFAIARPGTPQIGPAFSEANSHIRPILLSGTLTGVCLGFCTLVVTRWGGVWFALSLSVVVAFMMWAYVAIPSRLVGIPVRSVSRRDKTSASLIAAVMGAAVCTPPYALGRVGIVLLGSHRLFVLGIILIVIGVPLQAGATGAVKAIKMSAKLAVHGPDSVASPAS